MVCALLAVTLIDLGPLSVGWPLSAMADSPEYSEPPYLVVITYDNWDDLQRLTSLGLNVLDLQEDVLAAIVTSQELATLRSLGFAVRILDAPARPEKYYLVTLPPSGDTVALYRRGQVFPYVAGAFILKADPTEAELLPGEGFFIKKLFGPIVLPTSPRSAEAVTSTVLIQEHNPLIQDLVNSVSQTLIYNTICELQDDEHLPTVCDAEGSRYSYSLELAEERAYIRGRMEELGLDVQDQSFSLGGTTQYNIEGTLGGWGPGSDVVYIACAHYDSISNDPYNNAPGADDNASGTAAVLEAARILSPYRFKHTLRFVTFAAEEQGLIGSDYYATEARSAGTDIGGVINLDMIAWDSDGNNAMDIHVGTRGDSQALGTAFSNAMTIYGISLVPQTITWGATTFSDHDSFWDQGYPAMLAIEDLQDFNWYYYHSTSDTLDKLDLPYAEEFVQTTVATLAELAEIIPPGVRVEHTGSGAVMTDTLTALTVTYSNLGPDPATGVVITDTLSAGLAYIHDSSEFTVTQPVSGTVVWQVGDVMSHTQSSFVVTASVAATLPAGAHVTSTVDITGVVAWDNPGDNRATWTSFVPYTRVYLPLLFKDSP